MRAIPGAAEKATAAALNRAAAAGRETAIAGVLGRYAAKGGDVRAAISATTARPENLVSQIILPPVTHLLAGLVHPFSRSSQVSPESKAGLVDPKELGDD